MAMSEAMMVARLSAVAGPTSAILSWSAAGQAFGYRVFQNGLPIGMTTQTRFAVAGLQESTGYVFTIAAVDEAGHSVDSDPITLLTVPTRCERIAP